MCNPSAFIVLGVCARACTWLTLATDLGGGDCTRALAVFNHPQNWAVSNSPQNWAVLAARTFLAYVPAPTLADHT